MGPGERIVEVHWGVKVPIILIKILGVLDLSLVFVEDPITEIRSRFGIGAGSGFDDMGNITLPPIGLIDPKLYDDVAMWSPVFNPVTISTILSSTAYDHFDHNGIPHTHIDGFSPTSEHSFLVNFKNCTLAQFRIEGRANTYVTSNINTPSDNPQVSFLNYPLSVLVNVNAYKADTQFFYGSDEQITTPLPPLWSYEAIVPSNIGVYTGTGPYFYQNTPPPGPSIQLIFDKNGLVAYNNIIHFLA